MNETPQHFESSWFLVGTQIVAILICLALLVGLVTLARVVWRAWRKKQ